MVLTRIHIRTPRPTFHAHLHRQAPRRTLIIDSITILYKPPVRPKIEGEASRQIIRLNGSALARVHIQTKDFCVLQVQVRVELAVEDRLCGYFQTISLNVEV